LEVAGEFPRRWEAFAAVVLFLSLNYLLYDPAYGFPHFSHLLFWPGLADFSRTPFGTALPCGQQRKRK
jgi:hypothetical protein